MSRIHEPRAFLVEPRCAVCGRPATHVELRPEDEGWRFISRGIAGGNGGGDIITDERAGLLTAAFANPPDFELMRKADLHYDNAGYCIQCAVPYCADDWALTASGCGTCPRGHRHSLDPHWSP
ncbi:MAG: hypothetical protein ABSE77_08885 [Acidimicrobiales bacterium]